MHPISDPTQFGVTAACIVVDANLVTLLQRSPALRTMRTSRAIVIPYRRARPGCLTGEPFRRNGDQPPITAKRRPSRFAIRTDSPSRNESPSSIEGKLAERWVTAVSGAYMMMRTLIIMWGSCRKDDSRRPQRIGVADAHVVRRVPGFILHEVIADDWRMAARQPRPRRSG